MLSNNFDAKKIAIKDKDSKILSDYLKNNQLGGKFF